MKKLFVLLLILLSALLLLILSGCSSIIDNKENNNQAENNNQNEVINMQVTSQSFANNQKIPSKFTCDGINVNPELNMSGIPKEAKSLAIIVDDPDAPSGDFVHWLIWNIPVADKINENSSPGMEGLNDFNKNNYNGPCPPSGSHRYFFKVYALNTELALNKDAKKPDLEKAMKNHILAEGKLIGLYR